ncbi:MAG: hypothetical protein QXI91_00050 [Candidatus Bathyarchaeia archaeon]
MSESGEKPSSNYIIVFYIVGLLCAIVLQLDPPDPEWTILFMGLIFCYIAGCGAVYSDAKKIEAYAKSKGKTSPLSPKTSLIATILMWILAIPIYLYRRSKVIHSL